ncbi:MAG: exodeoxyribonuclease VII small subunit [Nannocystaceae bacterium]
MATSKKGTRARSGKKTSESGEGAQEERVETLLDELDEVVEALEAGDASLEESLERFERGVQLAKKSHRALDAMEQRVERLIADRDGVEVEEMDADDV